MCIREWDAWRRPAHLAAFLWCVRCARCVRHMRVRCARHLAAAVEVDLEERELTPQLHHPELAGMVVGEGLLAEGTSAEEVVLLTGGERRS